MGSLYPSVRIVVFFVFPFFCRRRHCSSFLGSYGFRLRLIKTVRGESYDGDREDMSAATGAPEEVVGDHSFYLHF